MSDNEGNFILFAVTALWSVRLQFVLRFDKIEAFHVKEIY